MNPSQPKTNRFSRPNLQSWPHAGRKDALLPALQAVGSGSQRHCHWRKGSRHFREIWVTSQCSWRNLAACRPQQLRFPLAVRFLLCYETYWLHSSRTLSDGWFGGPTGPIAEICWAGFALALCSKNEHANLANSAQCVDSPEHCHATVRAPGKHLASVFCRLPEIWPDVCEDYRL